MPDEPTWTSEDVETLAVFMGWESVSTGDLDMWFDRKAKRSHCGPRTRRFREERWGMKTEAPLYWNPMEDANADFQVLERAREVWADPLQAARVSFLANLRERWIARLPADEVPSLAWYAQYVCGDWSRAALAVLKEMEAQG
jgi:hypothetical protein